MNAKRIQRTRNVLSEYRNALQDMAFDLEDRVEYSELPADAANELAEKLYAAMRDMEELHRQFNTAIEQGEL